MKRLILSTLSLLCLVSVGAQNTNCCKSSNENVTIHTFDNFKVHIYTSSEPMGDVTLLIEGEKKLVVFEPQSFYKSIADFNAYAEALNKPIEKIVANYHAGGLAECDLKKVVMVEPMVAFMNSPMAQGMMSKFDEVFQGAMDTRSVKVKRTIPTQSSQQWAGVTFDFTKGATSDFPASSVNIGSKVFYTHFAPAKSHPSPMQLSSREAVDATLTEMTKAKESGCELFIGSHGAVATIAEVEFMIEYLEKVKVLLDKCKDSDSFGQRLIASYPKLVGYINIRGIAKNLYPNEPICADKEVLRGRMQDYLNMVSTQDMSIAKGLWAEKESITIINPRTQFFGFDEIMKFINGFSTIHKLKMSSISEVINISGNLGYVQLYWLWDETDANGEKSIGQGRESLIFEKIDDQWRLVHVHYSRMP